MDAGFRRHDSRGFGVPPADNAAAAIVPGSGCVRCDCHHKPITRTGDVTQTFGSADILRSGRAIFDIGGNKYQLVAAIHYRGKRVYVRFIGTHKEYDEIDAETV